MKLIRQEKYQCAAIVKPGEYYLDKWDNKQCTETNPYNLAKCEHCGNRYCVWQHWRWHRCEGDDA